MQKFRPTYWLLFLLLPVLVASAHSWGPKPTEADRLRAFLKPLAGTWADEKALVETPEASAWQIQIDPSRVQGGEALILVQEYCGEGQADFLYFRLVGKKLIMTGASRDGCRIHMDRIEYVTLEPRYRQEDTVLMYRAREVEYQNEVNLPLYRRPKTPEISRFWACGLQDKLTEVLKTSPYRILDAFDRPVSVEEAFGRPDLVQELEFFEANTVLWPTYEELCIRTPFDIVNIPLSGATPIYQTFAIEWDPQEIRLYRTFRFQAESGDMIGLRKGPLAYRIELP
ncbi:MAG: hypothetical protein AAFP92_32695, partial [Bacteroidota bacterium]